MHDIDAVGAPQPAPQERFWGHPRQLWMLLFVTVFFNFAFYGIRAFLAPYIAQAFFANPTSDEAIRQADLLTSGFGALLYAAHIFGGWVADNVLGEVRSLRMALWLAAAALLGMAWPSREGFELGMALLVLAVGLSIPLTVLIGRNYVGEDPRRDGGYTLYYLAINLGAFLAPFVCAAWIGVHYGYRYGFIAASAGMALAAVVFHWRGGRIDAPTVPDTRWRGRAGIGWTLLGMAVLVYPTSLLLAHPQWLHVALRVLLGLLVLYFVISGIRRRDRVQAQRYVAMLLLFAANIAFWALSLQGMTSLNFFARDHVDAPFNFTVFQSFNSLYILAFAPLLALLWPWLGRRGRDPSTPRKFGIGLVLVAFSYAVMYWAIVHVAGVDGRVGWLFLALCYLLQTLGELTLSPIGYAMVTRLAAPEEASLAMGGWFFGVSLAYDLSGQIAAMTTGGGSGMGAYAHVYGLLFVVGLGVSALFLLAAPWISRLMHGVR